MRILELRAENFKRLSVVAISPTGHVTEITGENGAGKTTVLDAIWAACGGKNAVPEHPIRLGHSSARIELKIGTDPQAPVYVVERRFTESDTYIKVMDADGSRHTKPETILKNLMGAIGFDPLAFTQMDRAEQYKVLRGLVKIEVDIDALERKRASLYDGRTELGRDLKKAQGAAQSIVVPDGLPEVAPDVQAITDRLTNVDKYNSTIRQIRASRDNAEARIAVSQRESEDLNRQLRNLLDECERLERSIADKGTKLEEDLAALAACEKAVAEAGEFEDAAAVRGELDRAMLVKAGLDRQQQKIDAMAAVAGLERMIEEKAAAIEELDATKQKAIAAAKMPIEGLSFVGESVVYKGLSLAEASAAERLRVSVAIGAALNPKLRVLLVRDGSLLDSKSRKALYDFVAENNMDLWIERVDESGEVGVVLVDGHVKGQEEMVEIFERGEQDKKTEAGEPAQPGQERMARVRHYLDGRLAALTDYRAARDMVSIDKINAEVKVKLQHFPELIATEWNSAYLEAVRECRKQPHG